MPILDQLIRLLLSAILGAFLGSERKHVGKPAGPRTYSLVAVGSCLFSLLSLYGFASPVTDPSRIAAQIVVGIGFIGAGMIFFQNRREDTHEEAVKGLTTAAGLWVSAAIGMSVAVGWYAVGIFTAVVTYLIFWLVEVRIKKEKTK